MADPNDMAKLYYTMQTVTEMRYGGRTDAYVEFRDGKNRSAQTVLYEKLIGNNLLCSGKLLLDTKGVVFVQTMVY